MSFGGLSDFQNNLLVQPQRLRVDSLCVDCQADGSDVKRLKVGSHVELDPFSVRVETSETHFVEFNVSLSMNCGQDQPDAFTGFKIGWPVKTSLKRRGSTSWAE